MNYKNSKTSYPHKLFCNLTYKRNLKRSDKYVPLSILTIYYTWKNLKKSCKSNKCKKSAPTASISDTQNYFEYILKKHGERLLIV